MANAIAIAASSDVWHSAKLINEKELLDYHYTVPANRPSVSIKYITREKLERYIMACRHLSGNIPI